MNQEPNDFQSGPQVPYLAQPSLGADQRREPRVTLVIRTAKIIAGEREFLCIIRDVTATGVKLQLFHPLPTVTALQLEMGNGVRYPISLAWNEGEYAGFRFDGRFNLQTLIRGPDNTLPKRQIRLRTTLQGELKLGGEVFDIVFQDISQQGACIECDSFLAIDQLVQIETEILPPFYAKVRWRRRPCYGLIFEQTFKFEELARRLAPLLSPERPIASR